MEKKINYIDEEKRIIKKVINRFIKNKNKIQEELKNKKMNIIIDNLYKYINKSSNNFYYNASTYLIPYFEKIIYNTPNRLLKLCSSIIYSGTNHILKDIVNSDKEDINKYIINLYENFSILIFNFSKKLDNYEYLKNNKSIFLKEFCIGSFFSFMIFNIGKIKNFELWNIIQSLWIIFDNIMDIPQLDKVIVKNCVNFFENKIYYKSKIEINNFFSKIKNDALIDLLQELFELESIKYNEKIKIFEKFYTIYDYSYKLKGFNKERDIKNSSEMLEVCIHKAMYSVDLFIHCLDFENNEYSNYIYHRNELPINEKYLKKFYINCLSIQLFDDYLDLQEDIKTNGNTIFTLKNKKKRCIYIINILENVFKHNKHLSNLYLSFFIAITHYNKEFLIDEFSQRICSKININYKICNLKKLFEMISNPFIVEKFLEIYNNSSNLEIKNYLSKKELSAEFNKINLT